MEAMMERAGGMVPTAVKQQDRTESAQRLVDVIVRCTVPYSRNRLLDRIAWIMRLGKRRVVTGSVVELALGQEARGEPEPLERS